MSLKYDVLELQQIDELVDNYNYKEALIKIREYMKKYPHDCFAMITYCEILYRLHDYKSARTNLEDYELPLNSSNTIKNKYYLLKVKIAIACRDFALAFDAYMKGRRNTSNSAGGYTNFFLSNTVYFFLKSRAGYLREDEIAKATSYMYKQIIDYSDKRLNDRVLNYNTIESDSFNNDNIKFRDDIDLSRLLEEVKLMYKYQESYYYGPLFVARVFEVDGCGYDSEGNICNYVVVISFADTDEILSIVPANNYSYIKPLKLDITKKERKVLSRSEKFNKKFNM